MDRLYYQHLAKTKVVEEACKKHGDALSDGKLVMPFRPKEMLKDPYSGISFVSLANLFKQTHDSLIKEKKTEIKKNLAQNRTSVKRS